MKECLKNVRSAEKIKMMKCKKLPHLNKNGGVLLFIVLQQELQELLAL